MADVTDKTNDVTRGMKDISSRATNVVQELDPAISALALDRDAGQVGVETFTLIVIWILAVTGNAFVCIVINRSRRIQSTTNYFVISLACSDLALALLCIPFIASRVITSRWLLGDAICKFVRFVQFLVPCVNMYTLVSIAIDRFYTIIYPLSFKVTKCTAKRMIILSWVSAAILSGFCFYFFDVISDVDGAGRNVCPTYVSTGSWSGIVYILFVFSCEVIIPSIILLTCYIRVFKHIWRIHLGSRLLQRTMNPVPRTKVKVVKMLIIVTLLSVLFYVPFHVCQLWYCVAKPSRADPTLYIAVAWMMFGNGVTKPLVYLCYNSNFRRGCKEVLCMSTMRCYRSNTYAITNASTFGKRNHIGIMETSVTDQGQDSPSKSFNRSHMLEKSAWPLPSAASSTYI
ncbi:probable G-protein coupled receptor 19 [Haliotis rubra]|uniref:probable G-protein coupled receptor 19 n=1 Tax=Haliotis rubra TaxID=36100 RepID=UPI001EE62CA1|nr:probable G-protein coupled receptor 19 [Haliotis rubra]